MCELVVINPDITSRLNAQETDDGRLYVTSPDLKGFHFVLNPDEDPMEAMLPSLEEMLRILLKAERVTLRPAYTPRGYRVRQKFMRASVAEAPWKSMLPETVVAAVA